MIPELTASGLLPIGIHQAEWKEFVEVFGATPKRAALLQGLQLACRALGVAGCPSIWVDGSFVTDKERPGDYDACWDWNGVVPADLDPVLIDYSSRGRATMKAKYLGDLFIAGVVEGGSGLPFVDFFQRTRDGDSKGIIQLDPREV